MSIGIITVAYGATYRGFLLRWAAAVNALHTQPDVVTIMTDDTGDALRQTADLRAPVQIHTIQGTHKHHPQVYANQALEHTDTDWICKMDVDDVIYPHAFNNLRNAACDVWMFGITHNGHTLLPGHVSAKDVLASPHNLVFSGSPYRKWLTTGAKYRDMIYEDWAFWIDCAKQGARFCPSPTADYDYVMHGENISTRADDGYWQAIVRSLK